MIPNRAIIVGSGASIRQGLWDTPIEYLPIWQALKGEFTISCNWSSKWIDSTIAMFVDYRFYCLEKQMLDTKPLVVGVQNSFYDCKDRYKEYFDSLGDNVRLLKPYGSNDGIFHGKDSWIKGFYTTMQTGLLALGFALTLGVKEIYLLGFDACSIDGRTHFYEGDDDRTGVIQWNNQQQTGVGIDERGNYRNDVYNKNTSDSFFEPLSRTDAQIYNVSPDSNITIFPKLSYEEFYKTYTTNDKIDQSVVQEEIKRIIDVNNNN